MLFLHYMAQEVVSLYKYFDSLAVFRLWYLVCKYDAKHHIYAKRSNTGSDGEHLPNH